MTGKFTLKDGAQYLGKGFGKDKALAGEVVFATGMVGYPESLTDPSYAGQILVLTYPLAGNYGVAERKFWESKKIQVSGLIVSSYIDTPSHHQSRQTLSEWLKKEDIPALEIKDTRGLTQKLRQQGVMLGKIEFGKEIKFVDPNLENLVAKVSRRKPAIYGKGKKTIVLMDCGAKENIVRDLVKRNVRVMVVPWNYDVFAKKIKFNGLLISNGPGDPKQAKETIAIVKKTLAKKVPTFGICLGNQILALAAGGDTYKLKFGHRSQNQPAVISGTNKCYLTTQNHGFAVGKIPKGFKEWFYNANDKTNEGIIHKKLPFMSVQFHPEACPGPADTGWLFDYFLGKCKM